MTKSYQEVLTTTTTTTTTTTKPPFTTTTSTTTTTTNTNTTATRGKRVKEDKKGSWGMNQGGDLAPARGGRRI